MYYDNNIVHTILLFLLTSCLYSREIIIRVNIPGAQIFQWSYIQKSNQVQSTTSIALPNDETKLHNSNEISQSMNESGEPVTEKMISEPDGGLESLDEFLQWLKDHPAPLEKPIEEILDISHHFQSSVDPGVN